MAHPHLRDRRTVRTIHDRIIGEFQVPGFPLRFSEFPGELDLEAPFLGEHNRRILTEYLRYSDSQIDQLERNGALKSAPH
jgi:CoA:oxalate CoA-transferase